MTMTRLQINQLAVDGFQPLDLVVDGGECVGIYGPSGIGKTRLLRAIVDLEPHQGDVSLGDVACSDMMASEWRRKVGFLPAESHWWSETVGEHFAADTVDAEPVGIREDVSNWSISRLSTGERQRLAILRLLENGPQALLLDEPTASLDQDNIDRVESLLAQLRETQQLPVIWISHDRQQLKRVAQRIFRFESQGLVEESA